MSTQSRSFGLIVLVLLFNGAICYLENNFTVQHRACRAEIPFVARLKRELHTGKFNQKQKLVVTAYLEDYEDSIGGLDGFLELDLERQIALVTRSHLSVFRLIDRIYHFHPRLHELGIPVPNFLPPFNGSQGFFSFRDICNVRLGLLNSISLYNWNVSMFADGYIFDQKVGPSLLARQCYELATSDCYLTEERYHWIEIEFLEVAREKVKHDRSMNGSEIELALASAIKEHDLMYKSEKGKYWRLFDKKMAPMRRRYPDTYRKMRYPQRQTLGYENNIIGDVCLFGDLRSEDLRRKLFCWHDSSQDPYWTLHPLKVEQIGEDVDIFLVHNVFGPKTIETFKEASFRVFPWEWKNTEIDRYIIHPFIRLHVPPHKLHGLGLPTYVKTMEKLTGLNFNAGDVVLGYYLPGESMAIHSDYLESPEMGGGTSFTSTRVAAQPSPGSLVYWYSAKRDGFPEIESTHCLCSVALGRKWNVRTTTLYREQFLKKPCGLRPLEKVKVFKIPRHIARLQRQDWRRIFKLNN